MKKTIGENLRAYRLKNGLSMNAASKKIGVSAPAILKYETNQMMPSLSRLEAFAKIYNCDIEEILDTGTISDIKFDNFKCTQKASFIKQERIRNILSKKINNYFELLKLSNITLQNKFGVHIINTPEEAEKLATKLRIFFTIPLDSPLHDLAYLLETNGIILITIPKDENTNEFIGFYENINGIPVIAVPKADNGYEQRYNIAKFLGELLIKADTNKDEITTNFALSLLIPRGSLIREFGKNRVKIDFKEIDIYSNRFKASYKNIIKRLQACEVITPSCAKYLNIDINKNNKKENIYIEEAYNYEKMLYKLYAQGIIKDLNKYL